MTDSNINYGISRYNNINGVTCYMNSILSILQQTPIFADYIVTYSFKNVLEKKYKDKNIETSPLYQLYKLFKISMSNDNFTITPRTFRDTITVKDSMWGDQQHQDSQEFLTFILGQLENDIMEKVEFIPGRKINYPNMENIPQKNNLLENIPRKNNLLEKNIIQILATSYWHKFIKNEYSLIKILFTGMTRMTTTCEFCSNQSNNFDIFQTLQLSVPISTDKNKTFTLDECFNNYISMEQLDENNKMKCNFCFLKNKSNKKTMLWKTPKILIIHIKRFMMNNYGLISQKITNMVTYPHENFNINNIIDTMSPEYNTNIKYNLFAVNCHHNIGMFNTLNFGHYTSMVKNRYNNCWHNYDDGAPIKEITTVEQLVSPNAYMLFYMKE